MDTFVDDSVSSTKLTMVLLLRIYLTTCLNKIQPLMVLEQTQLYMPVWYELNVIAILSSLSACISEWDKLDCHIRDLPTISSFKRALFKFFRPSTPSIYKVHDSKGVTFLTCLRVGLSHLKEHKFRHKFLDTTDFFCSCPTNYIENTENYLLQCSNYSNQCLILFNDLLRQSIAVLPYSVTNLCRIFVYGDSQLSDFTTMLLLVQLSNILLLLFALVDPCLTNTTSVH